MYTFIPDSLLDLLDLKVQCSGTNPKEAVKRLCTTGVRTLARKTLGSTSSPTPSERKGRGDLCTALQICSFERGSCPCARGIVAQGVVDARASRSFVRRVVEMV